MKKIVVSGIQPTGNIHLGNYLGAIKNWVNLQNQDISCFFSVVDLHAITIPYDKNTFHDTIFNTALTLLSCGIDPEKSTLFIQSEVPYHANLAWLLSTATPYGDLSRMTQFKDKSQQHDQVGVGLFTYPILMAADILLYKGNHIPVGQDQLQHLELAREIARRFNERFQTDLFPLPKPLLSETVKLKGLDGEKKMSKSLNNYIALTDEDDVIDQKLRSAVTDPQRIRRDDKGDPSVCNVFSMHEIFSSPDEIKEIKENCQSAKIGCVDCKKILAKNLKQALQPIKEKKAHYEKDPSFVRDILSEGQKKASLVAEKTFKETLSVMGFTKK